MHFYSAVSLVRLIIFVLTTSFCVFVAQNGKADVLATGAINSTDGVASVGNNELTLSIGYGTLGGVVPGNPPTFNPPTFTDVFSFQLQASTVGSTFTLNSTNDPGFLTKLTDGSAEFIEVQISGGATSSYFKTEANTFFALPAGGNGIDFHGDLLSDVTFTVNSFSANSPGSNPNGNGQWTDFTYNVGISVDSAAVPEPSVCSLLLVGLTGVGLLAFLKRSRSKRPLRD